MWGSFATITQKPEIQDSFGIPLNLPQHRQRSKRSFSHDGRACSGTLGPRKLVVAQSSSKVFPFPQRPVTLVNGHKSFWKRQERCSYDTHVVVQQGPSSSAKTESFIQRALEQ